MQEQIKVTGDHFLMLHRPWVNIWGGIKNRGLSFLGNRGHAAISFVIKNGGTAPALGVITINSGLKFEPLPTPQTAKQVIDCNKNGFSPGAFGILLLPNETNEIDLGLDTQGQIPNDVGKRSGSRFAFGTATKWGRATARASCIDLSLYTGNEKLLRSASWMDFLSKLGWEANTKHALHKNFATCPKSRGFGVVLVQSRTTQVKTRRTNYLAFLNWLCKQGVAGSIPATSTNFFITSVVIASEASSQFALAVPCSTDSSTIIHSVLHSPGACGCSGSRAFNALVPVGTRMRRALRAGQLCSK